MSYYSQSSAPMDSVHFLITYGSIFAKVVGPDM
jgi:hypothetical protein